MVTQAETGQPGSTLVKVREWLALIGAVVVILGGMLGGMRLVVAPLYTEMQALRGDVQAMDARMNRMDARMQEEFKAVRGEIADIREDLVDIRKDIASLSERVTRVETLLERDADQTGVPGTPDVRP